MKKISTFSLLLIFMVNGFAQDFTTTQQKKVYQVLGAIGALYVDSIDNEKIVAGAIRGMLKELDPHSIYTEKEEVERLRAPLEGSFDGIGVQFQVLEDTILVVQTIAGCPAEKVGVLPGDKIMEIDKENVAGIKIPNSGVIKRLRGKRGTEVVVGIKRGKNNELIDFNIVRGKIPIHSVDATYMIDATTGYIKVNSFGSTTADEFLVALKKLKSEGMQDLILSLQGNGGGFLGTAIQLADHFLSANKMIVYTQGVHQRKSDAFSTLRGDFEEGRLVVLVDEYSASASEILSGAIQDWDRGVVVGRRTFGKGLVQRELPLIDGSLIRLTTARYYTPSGRSIQKDYNQGAEAYGKDIWNRMKHGELTNADSIHFPDSLRYSTKRLHRTVYGGGGIMPDVFVPLDTTMFTRSYRDLVAKGLVNKVTMNYLNKNRKKLARKYPTFEKYKGDFSDTDKLIRTLLKQAKNADIALDDEDMKRAMPLLRLQLKALLARDLWSMNEYYQIMDKFNSPLQKAVEILHKKGAYDDILTSKK